jgi:hypothetical protein
VAVTIGPHTLSSGQLVPAKRRSKSRQQTDTAYDGTVMVSGSQVVDRLFEIRCRVPRVEAEKIDYYIQNSLRYAAETVTVVDAYGVSRIMRYWDDETDYSIGGGGFTELNLLFREERVL